MLEEEKKKKKLVFPKYGIKMQTFLDQKYFCTIAANVQTGYLISICQQPTAMLQCTCISKAKTKL